MRKFVPLLAAGALLVASVPLSFAAYRVESRASVRVAVTSSSSSSMNHSGHDLLARVHAKVHELCLAVDPDPNSQNHLLCMKRVHQTLWTFLHRSFMDTQREERLTFNHGTHTNTERMNFFHMQADERRQFSKEFAQFRDNEHPMSSASSTSTSTSSSMSSVSSAGVSSMSGVSSSVSSY